jgi:hypothetical protein
VWRKHIYFSGPMIRESKDGNCHVCVKEGLSAGIIATTEVSIELRNLVRSLDFLML